MSKPHGFEKSKASHSWAKLVIPHSLSRHLPCFTVITQDYERKNSDLKGEALTLRRSGRGPRFSQGDGKVLCASGLRGGGVDGVAVSKALRLPAGPFRN